MTVVALIVETRFEGKGSVLFIFYRQIIIILFVSYKSCPRISIYYTFVKVWLLIHDVLIIYLAQFLSIKFSESAA